MGEMMHAMNRQVLRVRCIHMQAIIANIQVVHLQIQMNQYHSFSIHLYESIYSAKPRRAGAEPCCGTLLRCSGQDAGVRRDGLGAAGRGAREHGV